MFVKERWIVMDGNAHKINLLIKYNDGSTRIAKSKDIDYDYANLKNRATKYSSGIVGNDGLTFLSVCPGYATIKFVSSKSSQLEYSLVLRSSIYSKSEYLNNVKMTGFIFSCTLVIIASLLISLSNALKRRPILFVSVGLFIVVPMLFLFVNRFVLTGIIIYAVTVITCLMNLLVSLLLHKKYSDYSVFFAPSLTFKIFKRDELSEITI